MPEVESESEEDSYDSDDEIAASHHFPSTDEGPSDAGPSQPSTGLISHSFLLTLSQAPRGSDHLAANQRTSLKMKTMKIFEILVFS